MGAEVLKIYNTIAIQTYCRQCSQYCKYIVRMSYVQEPIFVAMGFPNINGFSLGCSGCSQNVKRQCDSTGDCDSTSNCDSRGSCDSRCNCDSRGSCDTIAEAVAIAEAIAITAAVAIAEALQ